MAAKKRKPFAVYYRLKTTFKESQFVYGRRRGKVHEILAARAKKMPRRFHRGIRLSVVSLRYDLNPLSYPLKKPER